MSFSVAFTGHRKISSDLNLESVKQNILDAIYRGADTFYCGMAYGFDLICCQILYELKRNYTIKIIACIPCKGQEKNFSLEDKIWYHNLLEICDEKIILSENYYNGCMQARDRYMVDHADEIIAYLNENGTGTAYTVNYAIKKGKKVKYVN